MSVFLWPPADYVVQSTSLPEVRVPDTAHVLVHFVLAGCRAAAQTSAHGEVAGTRVQLVHHRVDEAYELVDILGEGAYSSVCLGVGAPCSGVDGERVAVKVIDIAQLTTEKLRWRIHNELQINRLCMHHPNLVQLREVWETDEDACFVMEVCEGGELFERVAQRGRAGFSEAETMSVMRQLVAAVVFLHSQGVVHRDIKPENIMFSSPGEVLGNVVKLSDFGLSKFVDLSMLGGPAGFQAAAAERHVRLRDERASLKASTSGTPAYCAPERLDCDEEFETFAVDMWGLGCICYFMLCGIPPFYSDKEDELEHDDEITQLVFEGEVRFPDDRPLSMQARSFVLTLLAQDPLQRATALEAAAHPWFAVTNEEGGATGGVISVAAAAAASAAMGAQQWNGAALPSPASSAGMLLGEPFTPNSRSFLKSSLNKVIDTQRDLTFSP